MQKVAFTVGWKTCKTPIVKVSGYWPLKKWQRDFVASGIDERFLICNSTTGSGKSIAICALIAEKLRIDPTLKVVIAVPQTTIRGFEDQQFQLLDGTSFNFYVEQHLQQNLLVRSDASKIESLIEFLRGPLATTPHGRIIICTHATLVRVFESDPACMQHTLVVIDEGHHVLYGSAESDDVAPNKIGSLVRRAVENPEDNISLCMATATFFRGDLNPVIPRAHLEQFHKFDHPYDAHLRTCQHLRGIQYKFALYRGATYHDELTAIFERGIGRTIAYIPHPNIDKDTSKHEHVRLFYAAIAGNENPEVQGEDEIITLVRRGADWVRVINLVDDRDSSLRDKRKQAIDDDDRSGGGNIDIIISLNLLKEGANWQWADRIVMVGSRKSLVEVQQIIGRGLRDAPHKTVLDVYHLLPLVETEARRKQSLENYLSAVYLSLMMEDDFLPNEAAISSDRSLAAIRLKDMVTDVQDQAGAFREIFDDVLLSMSCHTLQGFETVVHEVLTARGVPEREHGIYAKRLWKMMERRVRMFMNLPSSATVNADLIQEFFLGYVGGVFDVKRVADLRKILYPRCGNDEEIRDLYLNGASCDQIAEKFGIGSSTVRRALDRLGVQRGRRKIRDPQWAVEQYVKHGNSFAGIGKELNCSSATVRRVLEDAGVLLSQDDAVRSVLSRNILRCYVDGMHAHDIAQILNVDVRGVQYQIDAFGPDAGRRFEQLRTKLAVVDMTVEELIRTRFEKHEGLTTKTEWHKFRDELLLPVCGGVVVAKWIDNIEHYWFVMRNHMYELPQWHEQSVSLDITRVSSRIIKPLRRWYDQLHAYVTKGIDIPKRIVRETFPDEYLDDVLLWATRPLGTWSDFRNMEHGHAWLDFVLGGEQILTPAGLAARLEKKKETSHRRFVDKHIKHCASLEDSTSEWDAYRYIGYLSDLRDDNWLSRANETEYAYRLASLLHRKSMVKLRVLFMKEFEQQLPFSDRELRRLFEWMRELLLTKENWWGARDTYDDDARRYLTGPSNTKVLFRILFRPSTFIDDDSQKEAEKQIQDERAKQEAFRAKTIAENKAKKEAAVTSRASISEQSLTSRVPVPWSTMTAKQRKAYIATKLASKKEDAA